MLLAGVAAFHVAYVWRPAAFLMVVYLFALWSLSCLATGRSAFYLGLAAGIAVYAPQLGFFWTLFGPPAVTLWLILAFWIGLFGLLVHKCRAQFGGVATALLAPFLWMGTEYFRSELYYLRFSWISPGYVFGENVPFTLLHSLGVYGVGFLLMACVGGVSLLKRRQSFWTGGLLLLALALLVNLPPVGTPGGSGKSAAAVQVAGMQMEFPAALEVPLALDKLVQKYPQAQLLVLSEYTFDGPVPDRVKAWCRRNQRYLIAGGKDRISRDLFYNTAFVIDPAGTVVFKQVKAVPIQFFKDGLPAPEQRPWPSPWGKIGLCVCYDLSYVRVMDNLVRQGAQALIAPTMDVTEWGENQHLLHARIAPARAAEYGLPIFRIASSGVSQMVDGTGKVLASAPFAGEGAMIAGALQLAERGELPWDRWLAPIAVLATIGAAFAFGLIQFRKWFARGARPKPKSSL